MAQNTALQTLINEVDSLLKRCDTRSQMYEAYIAVSVLATELLPKERKDIEQAHDKGISRYSQWEPDRHGNEAPTGSDYYTNTFNHQ